MVMETVVIAPGGKTCSGFHLEVEGVYVVTTAMERDGTSR